MYNKRSPYKRSMTSTINKQAVIIDEVLVPQGLLLGSVPNLTATKTKLAYNLTDNKLWIADGSTWNDISAGSNVTLAAIGNSTNANGATISASQVLTLQPASQTFGGVVTTGGQVFSGAKVFLDGITANGTNYASAVPVAATDNNGILVDGVAKTIKLELADQTHNGIVSTVAQTFGGQKNFPGLISIGAAGGAGVSNILGSYYKTSAPIAVTWDPTPLLFAAPIVSTLQCERIGDMIFIKVLKISAFPISQATIRSSVGVVPAEFRPASIKYATAVVINGYVDATITLQRNAPFNSWLGACSLDTSGNLVFGTSKDPVSGPITTDVTNTLVNFQGPNICGFFEQTLMFSAV